jgi:hypothetical protein
MIIQWLSKTVSHITWFLWYTFMSHKFTHLCSPLTTVWETVQQSSSITTPAVCQNDCKLLENKWAQCVAIHLPFSNSLSSKATWHHYSSADRRFARTLLLNRLHKRSVFNNTESADSIQLMKFCHNFCVIMLQYAIKESTIYCTVQSNGMS